MNVILYGKSKELSGVESVIKSITKAQNVPAFEHYPQARDYLACHDVDMMLLDADDDAVGWQYLAGVFATISKKTKIVLLSWNQDDAVRAYEAGVFDYLLKPVKKNQMERVMEKIMKKEKVEIA